jgi:hypothetical protein
MSFDIEYKKGDVDNVGAVLKENGVGVKLTGCTVVFVMKNDSGIRYVIDCSEGGTVNGVFIPFSAGGVTAEFTAVSTSEVGIFSGEFVVSNAYGSIRFPSGNVYVTVKIWEAI